VRRGPLGELVSWAAQGIRGEVTVVVAGAEAAAPTDDPDVLVGMVETTEAAGLTRKEAIAEVARQAGVPKRAVFDAVVRAKS
jgi:16S rRNA (cytidine1402-2'-O)-methyltransferase